MKCPKGLYLVKHSAQPGGLGTERALSRSYYLGDEMNPKKVYGSDTLIGVTLVEGIYDPQFKGSCGPQSMTPLFSCFQGAAPAACVVWCAGHAMRTATSTRPPAQW